MEKITAPSPTHARATIPLINNFHHTMTNINHSRLWLWPMVKIFKVLRTHAKNWLLVYDKFSLLAFQHFFCRHESRPYNRFGCPDSFVRLFIPLIVSHTPRKTKNEQTHWNQTLWHALSDSFRSITRTDNLGSFIHHQQWRRPRWKWMHAAAASKKKRDCWWLPAIYWKSFITMLMESEELKRVRPWRMRVCGSFWCKRITAMPRQREK